MTKIFTYPITAIYYAIFFIVLCIFHPIQFICLKIFGYEAHKKSVDILNLVLIRITNLLNIKFQFENIDRIPENVPLILVANHQSMYDIIGVIWYLRKFHVKFVSKKELGSGVPSISYNLRNGGSVLIDRKDPKQAIVEISKLSKYIETHKKSALIFPEGTRSKTGVPKKFSETGLKILCKYAPSAYIVPISINNSWKIVRHGLFPIGMNQKPTFIIGESFAVKDFSFEEIMQKTEQAILQNLE